MESGALQNITESKVTNNLEENNCFCPAAILISHIDNIDLSHIENIDLTPQLIF